MLIMLITPFNLAPPAPMPMQIANPAVVSKVERAAKLYGLSKTATVEAAVDLLLSQAEHQQPTANRQQRFRALLAQMDQVPDRTDATDPLAWDALGLPK